MRSPLKLAEPGYFDMMTIKTRIGSLLFDILLDRNFTSRRIRTVEKHNHYVFEIQFFEAGSGSLTVSDEVHPIAAGAVHFIGPGVYHAIKADPDDPISRFYIQFSVQDTHVCDDYFPEQETRKIVEALFSVDGFRFADTASLWSLIGRIKAELNARPLGYYAHIQSLFNQMIVQIVRAIRPESANYAPPAKELDDLRTRIIEYYFTRYKDRLRLEELAGLLNLSTKQTNRILHAYYGVSFKQKLLETRIEVAKDLLRNTDWPLSRIAEEVGYVQPHNFSELFRKKTGMTPSQYQKRYRGCGQSP